MKSSLIVLMALIVSCAGGKDDPADKGGSIFKKAAKGPVSVTTYVVASREIPLVVNGEGRTEASDRYQAKAPGDVKIQSVSVEEGARVEPGDLLMKFDEEKIRLRLNLVRAEIQEGEAEAAHVANLQKNRDALVAEEKMSEVEADGLEERLSYAQAKADRARAEIEYLERSTELKELHSPFSGLVVKRTASEGAEAEEDEVLLEIVKLDPIYFSFPIASDVVTALEKEKDVAVVVRLQGAAQELTGEIAALGVENEGGGLAAKVRLPNSDFAIKPGLSGTAEIRTAAKRKIMTLPELAVIKGDKTHYVFKVEGGKTARRVPIELGPPHNNLPTVVKGLNEGDTIVALANGNLQDGGEIEVEAVKSALP